MKKIIFLFLIFSAVAFTEWEYSIRHNDYGVKFNEFTVYSIEDNSQLTVAITTDIHPGFSVVAIFNDKIKAKNNISLIIVNNVEEEDYFKYSVFKKDIENGAIRVRNLDNYNRGDSLTKMLLSAQAVMLFNDDTEEVLTSFISLGLKEIIEKKLGNSYWYKYKINE